jgi:hypothetical protein
MCWFLLTVLEVIDDYNIVAEVSFIEGANGSSSVVGQFVGASGARSYRKGIPGYSRESREQTIEGGL